MQRQLDLGRLVLGLDDALLQVEPVVGADGDAQEAEAADGEHAAEQGQSFPAAGAHCQQHRGPGSGCGTRDEPSNGASRGTGLPWIAPAL